MENGPIIEDLPIRYWGVPSQTVELPEVANQSPTN
jgi:hypothetical protein